MFSSIHHYESGISVKHLQTLHAEQNTDSKLVIFKLLILPVCFFLVLMWGKTEAISNTLGIEGHQERIF